MRSPRQRVAAVSLSMEMPRAVCVFQLLPVVRGGVGAADHLEVPAARMQEAPAALGTRLDRDLALVHQAVVQPARKSRRVSGFFPFISRWLHHNNREVKPS
jgi:hypothetical protein